MKSLMHRGCYVVRQCRKRPRQGLPRRGTEERSNDHIRRRSDSDPSRSLTLGRTTTAAATNEQPPLMKTGKFQLYNSLTKRIEPIETYVNVTNSQGTAREQTKGIAFYTCGPTVYGPAHLGHARTYIWLDIIRRCMEYQHQHVHQQWRTNLSGTTSEPPPPPPPPLFVMNITDVDDKIIQSAKNANVHPFQLARQYEIEFWNDLQTLNCLRPHVVTRVSEYVTSHIIPYIQQILQNEKAYILQRAKTSDDTATTNSSNSSNSNQDGIYFDICAFEQQSTSTSLRYGKLGPTNVTTEFYREHEHRPPLDSGANESSDNGDLHIAPSLLHDDGNSNELYERVRSVKRDSRDFVLWRFKQHSSSSSNSNDNETTDIGWNFPITSSKHDESDNLDEYCYGRPGWHVECSAMIDAIARQFQNTHSFTIHAGGIDLQFPHHTNEIAQAEAYHFKINNTTTAKSIDDETTPTCCHNESNSCMNQSDWIPHWVHTGHLHIDGMKMSKSLKNFITVKEFLQSSTDDNQSSYSSRSDDLRIWCLGLSGSYRSTAVYSEERIVESHNIRNKIIQFLLDGEEWLLRHYDSNNVLQKQLTEYVQDYQSITNTTKWRDKDCALYHMVNDAVARSKSALMNDFDGSTYVEQTVRIAEAGRLYLREETTYIGPTEPVRIALQSLRDLLSFVGFTDATCRAGRSISSSTESERIGNQINYRAVITELAKFRSAIRRAAIDDHKKKKDDGSSTTPTENMKKILSLCDEVRDDIFPTLGIEFLDGKGIEVVDHDGKVTIDNWRYCIPKKTNGS